ncbi:MAG: NAD-dependent epimerase/dehydratase family protein [Egibacteraceae bacterium]
MLITGGAGALGSQLARRLITKGAGVTVLDDLSSGRKDLVPDSADLIVGDVSDSFILPPLFEERQFDYIFHLAALFANANSVDHPERDLEVNGAGTLAALRQAGRIGGLKRFVFASSSCVYGQVSGAISEQAPFQPETPYGITKTLGEMYARYFSEHCGFPVSIVRPFNAYGPGEYPGRYRNVIPNFIAAALRGEPLAITGDGTETRDFTFNLDVVDGMIGVATSEATIGRAYNLGSGRETPIGELVERILAITGGRSQVRYTERRAWDRTTNRKADISAARRDFGYRVTTSLDAGLKLTADWLRATL